MKAFLALPIVIEIETDNGLVGIIHAECPVNHWNDMRDLNGNRWLKEDCLWSRDVIRYRKTEIVEGIYKVYHGHTIVADVVEFDNRVYLDTGAFLPEGKLTVIQL